MATRKLKANEIYNGQVPELKIRSIKAANSLCRDGGNGFFVHGSLACCDKVLSVDVRDFPCKLTIVIICRFKPKYKTAV